VRLIEAGRVARLYAHLSSYLRRLPVRQRGQDVVEYGIIVAVIAVASILAFNALSSAERGYFGGIQPALAPTAPAFSAFVVSRSTSTTISCTPTSTVVNGSVSCTVSVTDTASGTTSAPLGIVTLTTNGTGSFSPGNTCTLTGPSSPTSCPAITYLPTAIGTGTHTLTAQYAPGNGDTTHAASTGTTAVTVTPRSTTTTINCTPATIPLNGSTSCSATVTDTALGTKSAPQGTVTWAVVSGGTGAFSPTSCSSLSPASPSATCTGITYTPSAGTGTHTITATYVPGGGDTVHNGSTSNSVGIAVVARATSIGVSCSPTSLPANTPTTCTATITDTDIGAATTPQGTVNWSNAGPSGTFNPTSCTPTAVTGSNPPASSCQTTYVANAAGSPVISATYSSSDGHAGQTGSAALTVTKRTTTTAVSCTAPFHVNVAIPCTASVSDNDTPPTSTPAGTVTWSTSGGGTFSAPTCNLSTGQCGVTYSPSATGNQTLTASYGGDTAHLSSFGPSPIAVSVRTTSTSVKCAAPHKLGQVGSCTATVSDSDLGTSITPTGIVTWSTTGSGTFSAGTCNLSGGQCSVGYTPSAKDNPIITGSYAGDPVHAPSSGTDTFNVT
jgi:Flp pilus assembly pilin Flp